MKINYLKSFCSAIICMLLFLPQLLNAQTATVKGKVIDQADKQPAIGASVILIDKDKRAIAGASTDIEGNYSLPVRDPNARITVSLLGYKTTEPIPVAGKAVINFQLISSNAQLSDVVIIGSPKSSNGTLTIDKRNLTTSTVTISAKDLEELQATSIDQALQGRLPGVDIATTSGDPGVGMQIRIRGTSTLNGTTDPLIVVDGMPYEISVPQDFNFSTSDEQGYGQLLNIAPSDISEISVLKDAAATAVWGSRGSNGVLLITTKRGRVGKPALTYVFKGSLSRQPGAIPLLSGSQYSTLIQEEYHNAGTPFALNPSARQFQYDRNDPYNYYNFSNNTDWVGALTQTGHTQNHDFSLNGGGERARYFISMGYNNTEGTTKGTSLNRINTRINLDYNVSNRIKFAANFAYTHVDNDQLYNSGLRGNAYTKMPNQAIYEYNEFGQLTANYFSPLSTAQGDYSQGVYNPLAMAMEGVNKSLGERITPSFKLNYSIIPNLLTAQGTVQVDINNQKQKTFLPQIATGRPFTDPNVNAASDQESDQFTVATKLDFTFSPQLGDKQTFLGVISLQSNDSRNSGQGLKTINTASSFLQDPSIPSRNNISGSVASSLTQSRNVGVLIQGQYGLLDRYILNAFIRGDGNSKFGTSNRYAFYPGVSARWRISGEPFMKNVKILDDLSLRASYGQSGNAPGANYAFYNIYQSFATSYLGETGVYSTDVELTNLKWETVTDRNLGLDITMFKNRLQVTADVYRKRTTDLFLPSVTTAAYNGYSSVDLNGGTLDNNGWELNVQGRILRTKNWNIDAQFNVAHNENIIREISPLYPRENNGRVTTNNAYKSYLQINNPFGSFYGFRYKGVYSDKNATIAQGRDGAPIIAPDGQQVYMRFGYPAIDYVFQPGDARYEDINYDGVIDYKDIVYLGNGNPKLTGGAGLTIKYKGNFQIASFFSWRTGNDLINGTKITTTNMYGFNNQSTEVLSRWRKEGDVTNVPRAVFGKGYNYLGSDRYVEDGSFLRLRSLTARYTVPRRLSEKLKIKSLAPYITVENIFTLTRYTGQDPEVSTRISNAFSTVIDNSQTPPAKTFTFGLNASF